MEILHANKGALRLMVEFQREGGEKKYDLDKLHGSFHINSLFNWHIMEILTVIAD